jgi:hypothetical protein
MSHTYFTNKISSSFLSYFIILLLPFLLFHWMIPFITNVTIGSDYLAFPIKQQMELLFSIKTGSFPLYVPGFGSGHSSSALTLGQVFHPLPYISSIMPGYWEGKAIEWNNIFKLLSLGISQLALFIFLRKIRLDVFYSFLLSLITIYNLLLLDLFRHGAPLEAYTGHLILCTVMGWYFIRPTKWKGPLCIIGATYLLICSGHPEEMYYGLVGSGLFACVAPYFISNMLPDRKVDIKTAIRFWLKTGSFIFLGILLSSFYIVPFYFDFVSYNILRVGQDYAKADHNLDTFVGTINNFFLPLRSLVYGAFGGSSLILTAFLLPFLRVLKVKIPRSIWSVWGILLFMFLFMQGSRTPIHRLVWEYLPFASSIRGPGRISIIMPFFIMLLLAWIVQAEPVSLRFRRSSITLKPSTVLVYFSLTVIACYYLIYITGYHVFSSEEFRELFSYPVGHFRFIPYFLFELIIVTAGIFSLIMLTGYSMRSGASAKLGFLLILFTLIQVGMVLKYRSAHWIEKRYDSPTFEEIQQQKKNRLDYIYYAGGGMYSAIVLNHLERTFIEPFLGKIYTQIVPVTDQSDAYERMELNRLPQQSFIEGYDSEKARTITEGAKDMKEGRVKLIYSSFNRLRFHVISEVPAILGLSYPFTGKWRAWKNGERVNIYRANGASHAVEIPEGESFIEFRYWSSAAFWGMLISCATFALFGLFVCFRGLTGLRSAIGIGIVLTISAGGFIHWYNSLYSGDNLSTEYTWIYTQPLKTPNLAYGKNTWVSPVPKICNVCAPDFSNKRVVDGDRSPGYGFTTRLLDSPSLFIDLHRIQTVKNIYLYESSQDSSINVRPLDISLSNNGNMWRTVASVDTLAKQYDPTHIVFEIPQTTRYIRITASGKSHLSLDEVEIYGP